MNSQDDFTAPLWFRLSDKSKANLKKIAMQVNGFGFEPPHRPRRKVHVECKVEDVEEIGRIMQEKPGFERE